MFLLGGISSPARISFLLGGSLLLIFGLRVLSRSLWVLCVTMTLLTLAAWVTIFSAMHRLVSHARHLEDRVAAGVLSLVLIGIAVGINALGWRAWLAGRAIEKAGFSLFTKAEEIPIAVNPRLSRAGNVQGPS